MNRGPYVNYHPDSSDILSQTCAPNIIDDAVRIFHGYVEVYPF